MRKIIIAATAIVLIITPGVAENAPRKNTAQAPQAQKIDPERLALAQKLIETTGANKLATQVMHMMAPQMTQMLVRVRPDKKKEIVSIMREVMKELSAPANMRQLTDQIARIYAEEFTAEEMRQILAFYKTPVGKKLIARMPNLVRRSQLAGRAWGQQMARKAMQRLRQKAKERGIDL